MLHEQCCLHGNTQETLDYKSIQNLKISYTIDKKQYGHLGRFVTYISYYTIVRFINNA